MDLTVDYIESAWKIKIPKIERVDGTASNHIGAVLSWPPDYYINRLKKIGFKGNKTKLLDAGCGACHWAIAASFINSQVKAIDGTKKYLDVGKKINLLFKRKNLALKLGKLEQLPYPDNYFDFIVMYNVWMYTDKTKSLQEAFRVLKPSGKIYLGCIAGLGWYLNLILQGLKEGKRYLIFDSAKAIKRKIHVYRREAETILADNGFKILAFGSDGKIGDKKIQVEPIGLEKKFGFYQIFEILAQKDSQPKNE